MNYKFQFQCSIRKQSPVIAVCMVPISIYAFGIVILGTGNWFLVNSLPNSSWSVTYYFLFNGFGAAFFSSMPFWHSFCSILFSWCCWAVKNGFRKYSVWKRFGRTLYFILPEYFIRSTIKSVWIESGLMSSVQIILPTSILCWSIFPCLYIFTAWAK